MVCPFCPWQFLPGGRQPIRNAALTEPSGIWRLTASGVKAARVACAARIKAHLMCTPFARHVRVARFARCSQHNINRRDAESCCALVKLCYVGTRRLDQFRVQNVIQRHFAVRAGLLALGLDLWLGRTA